MWISICTSRHTTLLRASVWDGREELGKTTKWTCVEEGIYFCKGLGIQSLKRESSIGWEMCPCKAVKAHDINHTHARLNKRKVKRKESDTATCTLCMHTCTLCTHTCTLYTHTCTLYTHTCTLYTHTCTLYTHTCTFASALLDSRPPPPTPSSNLRSHRRRIIYRLALDHHICIYIKVRLHRRRVIYRLALEHNIYIYIYIW
jgi:hypothetical protein